MGDTIKTFGEKYTIHDFQKYLYSLLIPFLEKNLGNEYVFDMMRLCIQPY